MAQNERVLADNGQDLRNVGTFFSILLVLGLGAVGLYAFLDAGTMVFGPILWAAAIVAAGGSLGFLFGVPKTLQGKAPLVERAEDNDAEARAPLYEQRVNTNLEEISDWLTKIVVGLGLVELKSVPELFWGLATRVSHSFGITPVLHESVSGAIVIFFGFGGFLGGYLTTRLYLQGAFKRAESDLNLIYRKVEESGRLAKASAFAVTTGGVQHRPPPEDPEGLALWHSDPHKTQDGRSEANARRLAAQITRLPGGPDYVGAVHLLVESTDPGRPLSGKVVFLLHPTFNKPEIPVDVGPSGKAELDILSEGAFTVAALADDGATRLELDLAQVTGAAQPFYEA